MRRRQFLASAVGLGAHGLWSSRTLAHSASGWHEDRARYPHGVASGDPDAHSVLLWTRYLPTGTRAASLVVEVADDARFERVIAARAVPIGPGSDYTCRVLVGGLQASRDYWYRFTDSSGSGSRIGRTRTAPAPDDARAVRFAFVSCQNINYGAQNAWRRMIFEDERAAADARLDFVLHLGDFIYELVWYPQDRPQGMYDRRIRDILRYASGERHEDFHVPTTLADYRNVYRAYLEDPDIQEARARWAFVSMWDNHEFSWLGWQGIQQFDGINRPAQTRKVAANQAWFEYQPARVRQPSGRLDRFDAPAVADTPVETFDAQGLGQETNNLKAIDSLIGYRRLRFGANVDLILTDQHSYRSEDPLGRDEAKVFNDPAFPEFVPEEVQQVLDAGREYAAGAAPAGIRYGGRLIDNFRRLEPAQTVLGARQKAWFLKTLRASRATWKVWANTAATLDMRADPQHLPAGLTVPWPGAGYAGFGGGDPSTAYRERAEIYRWVQEHQITGFATIAGDRHSFWAGVASASLPPQAFEPVGIAFVTGSISAPGMVEANEHRFPDPHPLRPLFIADGGARPAPTVNLLLKHGVRSALEYARSGDLVRARAQSNPDNAPHVAFVDMGGHGYAVVTADARQFSTEFVCIERPIEARGADGGPLRYRVLHRTPRWAHGEKPQLLQQVLEGDVGLSI